MRLVGLTRWVQADRQTVRPLAVLLAGLLLTSLVLDLAYRDIQKSRLVEFERQGDELLSRINDTLETHQYLLRGMRSLYDGAGHVGRRQFQGYLEAMNMAKNFPGAYAVSWIPRVPHHIVREFVRSVRNDRSLVDEGYPEFNLIPDQYAVEHHVITYLYPMEPNKLAFGVDISASSERLLTLEHARDSGTFAATPPLEVVSDDTVRRGILLMLPTYGDFQPKNLAQRRQYYRGMLTGIVRYGVLLGGAKLDQFSAVDFRDVSEVMKPEDIGSVRPFYRSGDASAEANTLYGTLQVANREWQIAMSLDRAAYVQLKSAKLLWVIAVCGLVITLMGVLGAARVTTSRSRDLRKSEMLSDDLLLARQELQAASNDLQQFAYVTSHDLQIPVRSIDLSVTLLEDILTTRMTPPVRDNLEHLRDAASRLHQLTQDLQDFSRLGRDTVQFESVDLNEVFSRAQQRLAPLLDEAEASIGVAPLPQIRGDRDQLEQLSTNLLSNAVKYRSPQRKLAVTVSARFDKGSWQISVADNGIGIEARFHEKVFKPFQRLHQHDDIVGTGLGLKICQQIAECHKGRIFVEESSDAGSTFTISLPVIDQLGKQAA